MVNHLEAALVRVQKTDDEIERLRRENESLRERLSGRKLEVSLFGQPLAESAKNASSNLLVFYVE